jgi:hypothetical protein
MIFKKISLPLQQEGEFNHHEGVDLYDDVITAPSGEGEPVSIHHVIIIS